MKLTERLREPVLARRPSMAGGMPGHVTSYQTDPLMLKAAERIYALETALLELVAAVEAGAFQSDADAAAASLGRTYLENAASLIGGEAA